MRRMLQHPLSGKWSRSSTTLRVTTTGGSAARSTSPPPRRPERRLSASPRCCGCSARISTGSGDCETPVGADDLADDPRAVVRSEPPDQACRIRGLSESAEGRAADEFLYLGEW